MIVSLCLGGLSAGFGLFFRSWIVFGVAFIAVVALDALIDSRFRRLEIADAKNEP